MIKETIAKYQNIWSLAAGILLTMLVGWIDYITGPEIVFSIFYLFPILVVTWFSSWKAPGFVFSFACAAFLLFSDDLTEMYSSLFIPFWNMFGHLAFFLIIVILVLRIKKDLAREKLLATTDSLTGVLNSRHYYEVVDHEIKRHTRYGNPFTLLFIDVDNFKSVNDTLGHSQGDSLLKQITKVIFESIRSTDTIGRLGGDEFSVLLPEEDFASAEVIIGKLLEMLASSVSNGAPNVTFSIGAVTMENASNFTADEIIRKADALMYNVKKNGKNGMLHEIISETKSEIGLPYQ
jgi:diguanylate cyclase (GGDEF)-like protein